MRGEAALNATLVVMCCTPFDDRSVSCSLRHFARQCVDVRLSFLDVVAMFGCCSLISPDTTCTVMTRRGGGRQQQTIVVCVNERVAPRCAVHRSVQYLMNGSKVGASSS